MKLKCILLFASYHFPKCASGKVGTVNLCQGHKRKVGETLTCTGNDYDSYGSQVIKSVTTGMWLLNKLPNTVLRIGPYVMTDYGNNHILESYVYRRFECVSKILLSKAVLSPNSFRLHHYIAQQVKLRLQLPSTRHR